MPTAFFCVCFENSYHCWMAESAHDPHATCEPLDVVWVPRNAAVKHLDRYNAAGSNVVCSPHCCEPACPQKIQQQITIAPQTISWLELPTLPQPTLQVKDLNSKSGRISPMVLK